MSETRTERPEGDQTSGRLWGCFCGEDVYSWDLQAHLIAHADQA